MPGATQGACAVADGLAVDRRGEVGRNSSGSLEGIYRRCGLCSEPLDRRDLAESVARGRSELALDEQVADNGVDDDRRASVSTPKELGGERSNRLDRQSEDCAAASEEVRNCAPSGRRGRGYI